MIGRVEIGGDIFDIRTQARPGNGRHFLFAHRLDVSPLRSVCTLAAVTPSARKALYCAAVFVCHMMI